MGSKPFLEHENCLLLVSYSVKMRVFIQSAQKLMGLRTLLSKLMGSAEPFKPMLTKPLVSTGIDKVPPSTRPTTPEMHHTFSLGAP